MKVVSLLIAVTVLTVPALAQDKKMANEGNTASAIKGMEERWEAAIQKGDSKTIEGMIAPDFAGVDEKDEVMTKASAMSHIKNDTNTYSATSLSHLKVRVYGPSCAVVIGDANEKGRGKDGKAFDHNYRFTDTWVERDGKWQCVAEQVALVNSK